MTVRAAKKDKEDPLDYDWLGKSTPGTSWATFYTVSPGSSVEGAILCSGVCLAQAYLAMNVLPGVCVILADSSYFEGRKGGFAYAAIPGNDEPT